MATKNKKKLWLKSPYLSFLFVLIFFSAQKILALEVPNYPVIGGETITANTELPAFAIYLFKAGMFIGYFSALISLIAAGVMYFLSPAIPQLLSSAKDRISGAISGILILTLTYLIITTINPQLSVFAISKPTNPPPIPSVSREPPGVIFYTSNDCSSDAKTESLKEVKSIKDLEKLKNKVNSVGIVQGGAPFISILYDSINFRGKCLYLDPNKPCNGNLEPFAASASVHLYSFSGSGDVSFYRNSYFDQSGGYYKITAAEINKGTNIFIKKLSDLQFKDQDGECNVPEKERDCTKYDADGRCAKDGWACPTLGGENISSIKIDGKYLVVLFYFRENDGANKGEEKDKDSGPWTACQEFPTVDDINYTGPQQIKWQMIRNSGGVIPNYVMIIPIRRQ